MGFLVYVAHIDVCVLLARCHSIGLPCTEDHARASRPQAALPIDRESLHPLNAHVWSCTTETLQLVMQAQRKGKCGRVELCSRVYVGEGIVEKDIKSNTLQ